MTDEPERTVVADRLTRAPTRRVDVFFYGLFMDEALLEANGALPTNVRPGLVRGYQLVIGERASLVQNGVGIAYGLVMSLTMGEVRALYAQPSVRAYHPEAVLAELEDGTTVPALCFNLEEPPSPDDRNLEYAAKLRALAERLRFPASYTAGIC